MYLIYRNNQQFGPYPLNTLCSYVENGQILSCDVASPTNNPLERNTVGFYLKENKMKVKVTHKGTLRSQLNDLGKEIVFPADLFNRKKLLADTRLIILALIGLLPAFLNIFTTVPTFTFYMISLYFSVIWGLFFYYFFKTNQVNVKKTIGIFFGTQVLIFILWDIISLPSFPIISQIYSWTHSDNFILNILGYILGVGILEETAKAIPIYILARKSKGPLIPQTLVFYGLMSGIAFGVFEGVQYQMGVNAELEYHASFFMNIARLTCLPFLHAIWAGIAGYFIAFAQLYPKYRKALYFLAIAIPAVIHGIYDVLGWSILGLSTTLLSVILLTSYLKQGVNTQSKLSN